MQRSGAERSTPGGSIDLTAPWPERRPIAGEKVGNWAAEVLTYDRAMSVAGQ